MSSSKKPKKESAALPYADAVARLDTILADLEEGRVDIDGLSALVAEAAELLALCRAKIQDAEVQVTRITEKLEETQVQPSEEVPSSQVSSAPEPEGEEPAGDEPHIPF